MTINASFSPEALLLSALTQEVRGLAGQRDDEFAPWAREVAGHLRQSGAMRDGGEAALAVAAGALRDIMYSGSWQFLLEDALQRPLVFARTLAIMLNGKPAPAKPAAGQLN